MNQKDFPAILQDQSIPRELYGEFERYLLNLNRYGLIEYSDLPQNINLGIIELYANWLYSLTKEDIEKFERGDFILLDSENSNLILRDNPLTGNGHIDFQNIAIEDNEPVMVAHSHPDDSMFSYNDVKYFLIRKEIFNDGIFPASIVATSKLNFLKIRSAQTPILDEKSYYRIDMFNHDDEIKEIREYFSYDNCYGTGVPEKKFRRLAFYSGINLFHPTSNDDYYLLYFHLILKNYYFAKVCKYGLYYSNKDGNYIRMTKGVVIEYIRSLILARFAIAEKWL